MEFNTHLAFFKGFFKGLPTDALPQEKEAIDLKSFINTLRISDLPGLSLTWVG